MERPVQSGLPDGRAYLARAVLRATKAMLDCRGQRGRLGMGVSLVTGVLRGEWVWKESVGATEPTAWLAPSGRPGLLA